MSACSGVTSTVGRLWAIKTHAHNLIFTLTIHRNGFWFADASRLTFQLLFRLNLWVGGVVCWADISMRRRGMSRPTAFNL
jgi:hypothetical protein